MHIFALLVSAAILCLSSEINLKQQLVDQLEKAQNSLYTIKVQYEEKVHVLQTQIKSIESERDKVLKEMGECSCILKYRQSYFDYFPPLFC